MVIVFFFLSLWRLEEEGLATDPSGLAGVKNETQDFLHLSEAAFFSVCMFDVLKGE